MNSAKLFRVVSNIISLVLTKLWQFGEVLATTEHEEAIVIAEVDYSLIELRR